MSATVGCGAGGATSVEPSSWSTPMTSRSSSSAWRAAVRMSAAVCSISAGGRSDRICRAPAWRVISDTRWATTSCISRAMRARSACRAWSASSRCSASARRARSCSDTTSCRRARTNIPHATTAANIAVVVTITIHHGTCSPLIRRFGGRTRKNSPAVTTLSRPIASAVCMRRCTATVNMAIVAATAVATEKIDSSAVRTATPTGKRRRSHSAAHEITPNTPSTTSTNGDGAGWSVAVEARKAAPTAADSTTQITSTVQSRPLRRMCRHGWSSRRSSSSRDAGMRPGWSGPPAVASTGTAPGMRSA